MLEWGRFKKGNSFFCGERENDWVHELDGDFNGSLPQGKRTGCGFDWTELVILPVGCPSKIIRVEEKKGWHLVPPTSLSPHRSMVAIPYPDHRNVCTSGLAVVIGRRARRVKAANATSFVAGYSSAQCFSDDFFLQSGDVSRASSFDAFHPVGPTLKPEMDFSGETVLFHNGQQIQRYENRLFLERLPSLIEELSDSMTLLPGDIILMVTPQPGASICPGHHLEAQVAGLRPVAINVGMRGSA